MILKKVDRGASTKRTARQKNTYIIICPSNRKQRKTQRMETKKTHAKKKYCIKQSMEQKCAKPAGALFDDYLLLFLAEHLFFLACARICLCTMFKLVCVFDFVTFSCLQPSFCKLQHNQQLYCVWPQLATVLNLSHHLDKENHLEKFSPNSSKKKNTILHLCISYLKVKKLLACLKVKLPPTEPISVAVTPASLTQPTPRPTLQF